MSMRLAAALVMLFGLAAAGPAAAGPADKGLDVYWVDVEGGAATLIVTPAGESILVDTGFPGGRDSGRIQRVATEAGLKRIDHLVVTHYHMDHFGGVAELAGLLPIGTLYDHGIESAPEGERADPRLEGYRQAKVAKRVLVQPGDEISLKQAPGAASLRFRFLGARQDFVYPSPARPNETICKGATGQAPDSSDNANSVVMLLEQGPFRFFDGGDLTWNVEGRLVCPVDRVGAVDVYQSNHHGADSSNNPVLVQTLAPTVVVVNNGPRKGGEKNTLAAARALPSLRDVYQVHRSLAEGVPNTTDALIANRDETCAGGYVKLSVDAAGKTYVLSVPSTGHQKTYETTAR
jgi:beta-lactamase superfamily II metal-dependent hydrolase